MPPVITRTYVPAPPRGRTAPPERPSRSVASTGETHRGRLRRARQQDAAAAGERLHGAARAKARAARTHRRLISPAGRVQEGRFVWVRRRAAALPAGFAAALRAGLAAALRRGSEAGLPAALDADLPAGLDADLPAGWALALEAGSDTGAVTAAVPVGAVRDGALAASGRVRLAPAAAFARLAGWRSAETVRSKRSD